MYQIKNVYYNLRDNYKFKVYGFNSIQYTDVELWNSLPVNLKTCDSINHFKRCLGKWITNVWSAMDVYIMYSLCILWHDIILFHGRKLAFS